MSENVHSASDLKQMQSLPLEYKIIMTKERIKAWYESWTRFEIVNDDTGKTRFETIDTRNYMAEPKLKDSEWIKSAFPGQVYVSFSGGKDSTVLKHIVDSMYDDVPAVFVNTGLEYPEIQRFVKDIKAGKYDGFNTDVHILRPEMRFDEVLNKYGYPVASKEVAGYVREAKHSKSEKLRTMRIQRLRGEYRRPDGQLSEFNCKKWGILLDAPFETSDKCCDVMKKKPINKYAKETGRKGIIGTMAAESRFRKQSWIRYGCNMYAEGSKQLSRPLSFWTNQDILHYLKKFNVPYCPVYGDIQVKKQENPADGQMRGKSISLIILDATNPKTRLKPRAVTEPAASSVCLDVILRKSRIDFSVLKKHTPGNMNIASTAAKWLTANGNRTRKAWN